MKNTQKSRSLKHIMKRGKCSLCNVKPRVLIIKRGKILEVTDIGITQEYFFFCLHCKRLVHTSSYTS